MDKKRVDQRVDYVSKCLLNVHGTGYSGILENISKDGASIEIIDTLPDTVNCGDTCILNVLLLSPVKYSCKILRMDASRIALQFLEQ